MPSKRSRQPGQDLPPPRPIGEQPALSLLPRGAYIMTAAFDGRRVGVMVELLQLAATDPPSVSLALPKGQPISPLVRDSHAFGICVVPPGDAFLPRHFARRDIGVEDLPDPFDGMGVYTLETGSPLIERAAACFDCSVTMHIDFEGDHELYIASVIASREHGSNG
jgi:flavin reductase (DIM6/NTAB) family NADH-FMN oxidoreductase RutF